MRKFKCDVCGYVYDPKVGVPEYGIPPGTPFEALPADFHCPVCGADRSCFFPLEEADKATSAESVAIEAEVDEVIPRTPTIKGFRFAAPNRVSYKPGQYLSLRLENSDDLTRCLSISNSPTEEGYLEVTKRITGSRFSQTLNRIEPGYPVSITYPMGTFTFEGEFPKIAMLSGGIGITPLRSMCRYIVDSGLQTSVCLLYGNRSLEEIAFKSDFDAMQRRNPRLKVVHCLGSAGPEWTGRRGVIDAAMVRDEIPDYKERVFYLCGPPGMVEALTAMLRNELQLPEPQIKTEGFTGY